MLGKARIAAARAACRAPHYFKDCALCTYGRNGENYIESYQASLNIKDPEAHRLAHAPAKATGHSMTRVVTAALRERYAKIEHRKGNASVSEPMAIADRAAAHLSHPYVDRAEFLCDENGLPK
jgi:antitoxin VapB